MEDARVDITGWRPVVISDGKRASRKWMTIGFAGPKREGKHPLALPDGTRCGEARTRKGAWRVLSVHAAVTRQSRPATPDEVERRMR